jgi:2,4-dienoyl-CoA reductase-like NADH-dependent reductase (Old Yellow Enzyme family)
MSILFSPLQLGPVTLSNRVVVSPMCQYVATDGSMGHWHHVHLGGLALSGAGLLTFETTHVTPEGRITPGCSGLYMDDNERALADVVALCRRVSPIKLALQIGHAGRKGSTNRPWDLPVSLPRDAGGWETLAPSALPFGSWHTPRAMTTDDIRGVVAAFAESAKRAERVDFDVLEIHMGHGYLINEFLSPLTNKRTDAYGGALEKRMRLALEVFEVVRTVWPRSRTLGAKIPGSDHAAGGFVAADAVVLARELKRLGADYVTVSGGGLVPNQTLPSGVGIHVPFAEQVKHESEITTGVVGLIFGAEQAEAILAEGRADFVVLARAFLSDPRWAYHAAAKLGVDVLFPKPYERSSPTNWPPARPAAA